MKHVLPFLFFAITISSVHAQCEPMFDFGDEPFGVSPDTVANFAPAEINVLYTQQIDVKVPETGAFLGDLFAFATIDSAAIMSISGLPDGLSYACQEVLPSPCTFPGGATGCGVISGVPTEGGVFDLQVLLVIYASIPPLPPSEIPFPVANYRIIVSDPLSTFQEPGGINLDQVFPNPAANRTQVSMWSRQSGIAQVTLYDLVGKVVLQRPWNLVPGDNTFSLNLAALSNGVYVCTVDAFGERTSSKVVVSR